VGLCIDLLRMSTACDRQRTNPHSSEHVYFNGTVHTKLEVRELQLVWCKRGDWNTRVQSNFANPVRLAGPHPNNMHLFGHLARMDENAGASQAKPSSNILQRTGVDHRGGRVHPG